MQIPDWVGSGKNARTHTPSLNKKQIKSGHWPPIPMIAWMSTHSHIANQLDSLRGWSDRSISIRNGFAWPLRKDDTHESRSVNVCLYLSHLDIGRLHADTHIWDPSPRHCVRAVKEMDSKSIGLCAQGFESHRCRFWRSLFLVLSFYLPRYFSFPSSLWELPFVFVKTTSFVNATNVENKQNRIKPCKPCNHENQENLGQNPKTFKTLQKSLANLKDKDNAPKRYACNGLMTTRQPNQCISNV